MSVRSVITSTISSRLLSVAAERRRRETAERARRAAGAAHVVEYFHQADDPYAQLVVQVLGAVEADVDDGRRYRSSRSRAEIVRAMHALLRGGDMSPCAARVADTAGVRRETAILQLSMRVGICSCPEVVRSLAATEGG
jgi:hypothetical protein